MDVEIDLASLDIEDDKTEGLNNENEATNGRISNKTNYTHFVRRSTRKSITNEAPKKVSGDGNRRTIKKPTKLNASSSLKEIEHYYVNKKVKSNISTSLETIYETPKNDLVMSTKKFRRFINLCSPIDGKTDLTKIRKRSMKAKKINGFKMKRNKKHNDELLKMLLTKIEQLEDVANISTKM